MPTEKLKKIAKDYHSRIARLEDEKYDLEYVVKKKDFEVEFPLEMKERHAKLKNQNKPKTFKK